MLPVLDPLFGHFSLPKRQWPALYGISGAVPDFWVDQLIRPVLGSFPLAPSTSPTSVETLTDTSDEAPALFSEKRLKIDVSRLRIRE